MLIQKSDLHKYGGKNLKARRYVEGESVFNSNNIDKIGIVANSSSSNFEIRAIVLQSSHVREHPFEVKGEIKKSKEVGKFVCTCPGGHLKCKHIMATLLHCLYFELPELSSTDLQCTWNKQTQARALKNYQPVPIYNHPCFSSSPPTTDRKLKDLTNEENPSKKSFPKRSALDSTELFDATSGDVLSASVPLVRNEVCDKESCVINNQCVDSVNVVTEEKSVKVAPGLEDFCRQVYLSSLPRCMFGKQNARRHAPVKLPERSKVSAHDREMYKEIFLNQDSELLEQVKLHKVDPIPECCQETLKNLTKDVMLVCESTRNFFADWLSERKYIVTGTSGYVLYTYTKNQKSPDEWRKKCANFIEPPSFSNAATEYGIKHESKAREIFKNQNPDLEVIETGLVKCSTMGWLGVTPDAVVFKNAKPFALLEIKCFTSGSKNTVDAVVEDQVGKCLERKNGSVVLKENHRFYGQVQQGMAILNVDLAYFVIHSSFEKKNYVIEVPKDIPFLSNMLPELKRMYFSVVLPEVCLRESKSPELSCHKEGKHFEFKARNSKGTPKQSKSKNDKPKESKLKSQKKQIKRKASDDVNKKPRKKANVRL